MNKVIQFRSIIDYAHRGMHPTGRKFRSEILKNCLKEFQEIEYDIVPFEIPVNASHAHNTILWLDKFNAEISQFEDELVELITKENEGEVAVMLWSNISRLHRYIYFYKCDIEHILNKRNEEVIHEDLLCLFCDEGNTDREVNAKIFLDYARRNSGKTRNIIMKLFNVGTTINIHNLPKEKYIIDLFARYGVTVKRGTTNTYLKQVDKYNRVSFDISL